MSQPELTGLADRLAAGIDRRGDAPLSSQIVDQVWLEVVSGILDSGERLPTVRQLAVALGTGPRTVERAYQQLEKLGVVVGRAGEGTFVSLAPPSSGVRERYFELERRCRELASRAEELGFAIDDVLDLLAELRSEHHVSDDAGATE